ncbi:uncharacterized protein METZ01_LOCUS404350, partial [marine metagenome]
YGLLLTLRLCHSGAGHTPAEVLEIMVYSQWRRPPQVDLKETAESSHVM